MLLGLRHWPSALQRLCGLGALLNVVAVHSKQFNLSPKAIESWYDDSITWIQELGCEPKTLAFVGVMGFEDGDGYEFEKAERKLRRKGFNDAPHITIMAAAPPGSSYWTPWVQVSIRNSLVQGIHSSIVWEWEREKRDLTHESVIDLVDRSSSWVSVDYALGCSDFSKYLPGNEAAVSPFESRQIIRRGIYSRSGYPTNKLREVGRHRIDFLRDIHPCQILSLQHLSYRLGGQTLREWIESSSGHGTLESCGNERWLWVIPENATEGIRRVLVEHRLLTLYLPDMGRILEDYGKPPASNTTP